MHFVEVAAPDWLLRIPVLRDPGRFHRLKYVAWQFAALRVARRLHRRRSFDVAWHVTWANAWLGSTAALLGVPFVFGPVGGGVEPPWRLARFLGASRSVLGDPANDRPVARPSHQPPRSDLLAARCTRPRPEPRDDALATTALPGQVRPVPECRPRRSSFASADRPSDGRICSLRRPPHPPQGRATRTRGDRDAAVMALGDPGRRSGGRSVAARLNASRSPIASNSVVCRRATKSCGSCGRKPTSLSSRASMMRVRLRWPRRSHRVFPLCASIAAVPAPLVASQSRSARRGGRSV